MILLLLNAFDLEEGSLTADNLNEMKDHLMATYPQEYAQLMPQIKNCSLEAELDTVSCHIVVSPLLPLSPDTPCELRSCLGRAGDHFYPSGWGRGSLELLACCVRAVGINQ